MVTGVRRLTTRQGKAFAAVTVEDLSGTAELTVWPDSYEQHQGLLVHGNVLLAKVEVRERGDRLTLAVAALASYDQDAGRPLNFDPSQFVPSRGRRRQRGADRAAANGVNGNGAAPRLEAVPPVPEATANGNGNGHGVPAAAPPPGNGLHNSAAAANGGRRNGATGGRRARPTPPPDGPERLWILIEETTDSGADRRRLGRIVQLLEAHPGAQPVEIELQAQDGRSERLRLPPVADIGALLPELKPLLGVLGSAAYAGEAQSAALSTAEAI